ncbi:hypothetical protein [Streptomyces osmaniensis]|uniref:Uncharacterized protein n=1 Tax=Streptomyces osmaniensis TaxID=593134 RepID=A0ABP6W288_9ACTN|nr:hypothetical protein KJK32_44280 [Streptomyces sp. JCM17656]
MITLYDVYKQGSDAVKAAVVAFGARHPSSSDGTVTEPDWGQAEKHFTAVIETVMPAVTPSTNGTAEGRVRRAENAAIDLLLAVKDLPRCPICVKRQGAQP